MATASRVTGMDDDGARLESEADELYLQHHYRAAAAKYERAFAAYRAERRWMSAGRAARMVAWVMGNVLGDWAVQGAWFDRALTVLDQGEDGGPEHGWASIIRSHSESDPAKRDRLLEQAVEIGRAVDEPDIEFEALSYRGAWMVMSGRVDEGLGLFDRAMAATCAGELRELGTVDSMFCGFFWVCELVHDVSRADQWMRAASTILEKRNVVAAFCRAHYGGILTAAGRWGEAESELVEAVRHFESGLRERRAAAIIRLAALRIRQGRTEEAGRLLKGFEDHPDALATVASLHLSNGDTSLARDLLERATSGEGEASVGDSTTAGPLLSLLVDVYLAEGDHAQAAVAVERLARLAQSQSGPYLRAAAAFAKGRLSTARGSGDPRASLYDALTGFARAAVPLELGRAHLAMAETLAKSAPDVAVKEARTALELFEQLSAARYADEAASLLRSLGAPPRTGIRTPGLLTRREEEVLDLIGVGLSNPEIADRLFISRKTVEHHVGNVLVKLGLRNRAEAAAYAVRRETGL